ncbi:spermidine synthase 2 [Quercus suber]|uniref:Spermidine synthase 2 n=1 Tax=Quercus suber TaxID=58331 RepID=A0AAW0MCM6_QUESU
MHSSQWVISLPLNAKGPQAEELSDVCFLESVVRALRPGGVMSTPAESLWFKNFVIADTIAHCSKIFKGLCFVYISIFSGLIGFMLCSSEEPPVDFKHPINPLNPESYGVAKGPPKFYNSEFVDPLQIEKRTMG